MATFLKTGIRRIATGLLVVCFAGRGVARGSDLGEIKGGLTNLLMQMDVLQMQISNLRTSLDLATNSVRNDIASLQDRLVTLKTAVETRTVLSDSSPIGQNQFASALHDLSNSVAALGGMIADLKTRNGTLDSKNELERQLAGLNTGFATFTNALLDLKPNASEAEMRENLAYVKNRIARANAEPVWFNYALLGLVAASLGLSGWGLANSRGQSSLLQYKTRETRELLLRFGAQMEGRVKSMEGSSVVVQNTAHEVNDFLGRVESAVRAQLDAVAQQLNSMQVNELAQGASSAAEQMTRLCSETTELKKFMGDLHESTQRWVADFEKQTGRTLQKIKDDMHALDDLLWPAPFRDGAKLGLARERIRKRASAGDKPAFALLLGIARLQLALASRDGDVATSVEALEHLGLLAYRFWKASGASVESTFEQAQEWGSEINKFLAELNVPLNIRIIMPGAGFDMAMMLSEHSATGTTTRVREPLSWVVVARNGEQASKVLVTGKVITE